MEFDEKDKHHLIEPKKFPSKHTNGTKPHTHVIMTRQTDIYNDLHNTLYRAQQLYK